MMQPSISLWESKPARRKPFRADCWIPSNLSWWFAWEVALSCFPAFYPYWLQFSTNLHWFEKSLVRRSSWKFYSKSLFINKDRIILLKRVNFANRPQLNEISSCEPIQPIICYFSWSTWNTSSRPLQVDQLPSSTLPTRLCNVSNHRNDTPPRIGASMFPKYASCGLSLHGLKRPQNMVLWRLFSNSESPLFKCETEEPLTDERTSSTNDT